MKISAIVPASGGMQAAIPAQGTRAALWHPAGLTPPQGPSPRTDDDDLRRARRFPRVFLQTNRDIADLREVAGWRLLAEGRRSLKMPKSKLFSRLERPGINFQRVAQEIATQPALLAETFTGMGAKQARIKYGCAKVLRLISEGSPHVLYPFFDRFVALCESENKILQWTAIIAIGNMAPVDAGSRIEMILDQYLGLIRGPVMITAANTIRSAAKIALAKPQLADRIARGILEVETARYQTAECRNVALGHAIASLQQFFPSLHDREPVLAMARRQLRNTRNATRQKATRFLAQEERAAA